MTHFPLFGSRVFRCGFLLVMLALLPLLSCASAKPIKGQDVNGVPVAVNGKGHCTVVLYTNPDLEDESRQMTLALDRFRSRSDFSLIRVVDLRGDVPPGMRGLVRGQIRKEIAREDLRLKKQQGIANAGAHAPIIPDFSGSTLNALGWNSVYTEVHCVVYDRGGHEIKRLTSVSDPHQLTQVVEAIL